MKKIGVIRSIGHNIAASLASGLGFMIGLVSSDIYAEALESAEGFILVDFLTGASRGGKPSETLAMAIRMYSEVLPGFCKKHGIDVSEIATLTARFGTDMAHGTHFTVTVEDRQGHSSVDTYLGVQGALVSNMRPVGLADQP